MNKISKMTYEDFIINGEVIEQLPLYNDNLINVYNITNDESLFSNYEIRAIDNTVKVQRGNSNFIRQVSNVRPINNLMNFNNSSVIALDGTPFNNTDFEFEIKFKVSDFSSNEITLANFRYVDEAGVTRSTMSLNINPTTRHIRMNTSIDTLTPSNSVNLFNLTDFGAINKNIWYTLKFCKYGNISTVNLNNMLTKILIYNEEKFKCENVTIGQSLIGEVEYIQATDYVESPNNTKQNIINSCFNDNFTTCLYWTPNIVSEYTLLELGSLKLESIYNRCVIRYENNDINEFLVREDNTYHISISYDKTIKTCSVYVYNQTLNSLVLEEVFNAEILTNAISVRKNSYISDLSLYSKALDKKTILRNSNRLFTMDKYGNLNYNIDEENIGFIFDDYRHLSIDSKIAGQYKSKLLINLIDSDNAELVNEEWSLLHKDSYLIPNWTSGYLSNVNNPTVGYHAKWVKELSSLDTMVLKFINCNSDFDMSNRLMHSSRLLDVASIWSKCSVGDKVKIFFEAKADIPCDIKLGIYRNLKSTGSNSFENSLETIRVNDDTWTQFCHEVTIGEDWNLSKTARVYFYGNLTDKATSYIRNIYLVVNGEKAPIEIIRQSEKKVVQIPFNETKAEFCILYNTKLFNKTSKAVNKIGNVYWGIEDNSLYVTYKGTTKKVSINPINFNEWITFGISIKPTRIVIYIGTKEGINSLEFSNITITTNDIKDIELDSNNCALYKDILTVKDEVNNEKFERYHRTKMSYVKHSMILKNDIRESNL